MDSKNIYALLSSKPHNQHYLSRYVKFIESCVQANLGLSEEIYTEDHHILPKASDLFPEYSDFNHHPWNLVELTARQHILAHVMLWKTFGGSQTFAVDYMLNRGNNSDKCITLSGRVIPTSVHIRYSAKIREDVRKERSGFGTYKDTSGNRYYLHQDDPKISELNLVGHVSGRKTTEEERELLKRSHDHHRKIKLRFLDISISVAVKDCQMYLDQGWMSFLTSEDLEYTLAQGYIKTGEKHKGRADYMYPDGMYYGKLSSNDPKITELGLVFHKTEARTNAARQNAKKASEMIQGSKIYNNGSIQKRFKADPGDGWVLGELDSDQILAARAARADGLRKVRAGATVYNDGSKNYYIKDGDSIDPSWSKGMAPQKKRDITNKNSGYVIYNDGVKNHRVYPGQIPDSNWVSGMLKSK